MSVSNRYQPTSYLMWFRRDLRIHDNTALSVLFDKLKDALHEKHKNKTNDLPVPKVLALYTLTPKQWLNQGMSVLQMDFIFRTLKQLATTLANELEVYLHLIYSDSFASSINEIVQFCNDHDITQVFANIEYEINEQHRDQRLTAQLAVQDIEFNLFHDQCILPPNTVKTNDDTLYKVFTPFYKKWQSILTASPVEVYEAPSSITGSITRSRNSNSKPNSDSKPNSTDNLDRLLTQIDDYHQQTLVLFKQHYTLAQSTLDTLLKQANTDYPAGEYTAKKRLKSFIKKDITNYDTARDKPADNSTSHLSAYLTVGSLSARLCYHMASKQLSQNQSGDASATDVKRWISELAWRDFYRHVIVDRPDIVKGTAYNKQADKKVIWSYDMDDFQVWCQGRTGVPLVDAAMRCLNQTGFMHNRLRMVTAMFLTKDLFIDWRWGERYFMQRLIDGDFASNNGGWQWSASVGTDAAPYFRIMNPFSQAKTHDKDALFIKTWLPELAQIPANILHDEHKLRQALSPQGAYNNVNYPTPMVEHKQARLYAIGQFKAGK
ncbi:cryptochrome/photolyase family protein [Psychrobacter lutiphocae]|uniref:cryptochrome/photolyase family protein n=1 Tax=Psychrobacter lutiphocae TaxID=540500 RepID=UPI0003817770|nr:FAD-binding domain-containing protein [Psychrobacter lutiphocae]